jgi:formamidopyrimidine-DNA glycosylase
MPELPEVETIRKQLAKKLIVKSIEKVEVRRAKCGEVFDS